MSNPRFGVSLPLGPRVADAAREAERLGFDYVTCGEHVAFHEPTANAFVSLATAAGATHRIGLFSAITLAPLYPAALLAKLVAALDNVSGGRFTLGVGVGGENPVEFKAVGVPPRERGARTDEALGILHQLLAEDDVHFSGRFTSIDGLTIAPRPATGRVPIWIAGRGSAAITRAVRFGDGWIPYLYTPERLAEGLQALRISGEEHGRPQWRGQVGVHLFTTVLPDPRRARRMAIEEVSRTYRQDFEPLADRYLLHGTAASCRARIEEYRQAGAGTFLLRLAGDSTELPGMLRRIMEDVVGPFRG